MNCPKCGCEMECGYLQSDHRTGISFVSKLLPFGMGFLQKDALPVAWEMKPGINALPASICRSCRLLIADYSEKE